MGRHGVEVGYPRKRDQLQHDIGYPSHTHNYTTFYATIDSTITTLSSIASSRALTHKHFPPTHSPATSRQEA